MNANLELRDWMACAAKSALSIVVILVVGQPSTAGPAGWVDPMILKSEPAVLIDYMQKENSIVPKDIGLWKDVSDNDLNSRFQDTNFRVIRFADAILRDPRSRPEELQQALDRKYEVLERLWVYFGSKSLAKPQFAFDKHPGDEFYAELRRSDRPFLARAAAIQGLAVDKIAHKAWLADDNGTRTAAQLEDRIASQLAKCERIAKEAADMSSFQFTFVSSDLRFYEYLALLQESRGHPDLVPHVIRVLRALRDSGKQSENSLVKNLANAPELAARLRGLNLRGQQLELRGPTTAGSDFEIGDCRGSVAIIVYFRDTKDAAATLLAAQKTARNASRSGVKLVGVYLGKSQSAMKKTLDTISVGFPIVFDSERAANGQPQPSEEMYELLWAPYAMIVDRSGRVVSVHTEPRRLDAVIQELQDSSLRN